MYGYLKYLSKIQHSIQILNKFVWRAVQFRDTLEIWLSHGIS